MIYPLLKALQTAVEARVAGLDMPAPGGGTAEPQVWIGAIPKSVAGDQAFPFVVIRPVRPFVTEQK